MKLPETPPQPGGTYSFHWDAYHDKARPDANSSMSGVGDLSVLCDQRGHRFVYDPVNGYARLTDLKGKSSLADHEKLELTLDIICREEPH
ncbi:hypothetical protein HYW21_03220 [Candidatus Woesearchaeota archaeon]|nr:hypothetical protein [Candidatus Woesearchaeota archaeon]